MIYDKFQLALKQTPDKPFVISSSGEWTYSEFYDYVRRTAQLLDQLEPGRVACHLPDSPQLVALMFASGLTGRSLVLFNHDYNAEQIEPLLAEVQVAILITDKSDITCSDGKVMTPETLDSEQREMEPLDLSSPANESEILIMTSGTTGKAKCARYEWRRLFAQVKEKTSLPDERWLLAYRLSHFAGVQMIVHILSNLTTLVIPRSSQVSDAIAALTEHQVSHVSSTPTFWRYALGLLKDKRKPISLKHLTLGSEASSEDLLNKLHELFPKARIVHIYASTEAGSCISVSDLKPGLPVSVLSRPNDADVQFRIVEDELYVKTPYGMTGYLNASDNVDKVEDGWRPTGDLVRIEEDRIIFTGRKSETINVGGVKVQPLDVENVISPLEGVKLVKAYGRENPVVGQIVAVDVVCNEQHDPTEVEAEIRAACDSLPRLSRPRSIRFVDSIHTSNLKISRRRDG